MSSTKIPQRNERSPENRSAETDESTTEAHEHIERAEEPSQLSLDEVFEILKNQRRRHVLHYLTGTEEQQVSLGELAEHIAARENGKSVDALTSSERKRVYVGLYQCHLPKMDDMNIVEFNQDRGFVALGQNVSQLTAYLDQDDNGTVGWHKYYLTAVVGGGGAIGLSQAAGVLSGSVALLATSAFIVGLACLAVFHSLDVYGYFPFGRGTSSPYSSDRTD